MLSFAYTSTLVSTHEILMGVDSSNIEKWCSSTASNQGIYNRALDGRIECWSWLWNITQGSIWSDLCYEKTVLWQWAHVCLFRCNMWMVKTNKQKKIRTMTLLPASGLNDNWSHVAQIGHFEELLWCFQYCSNNCYISYKQSHFWMIETFTLPLSHNLVFTEHLS